MDAASLGDPQTLNLYAYCGNDPINNVDPDGLFFGALWKGLKAIGKAIASFFSGKLGGISGPGFRTPPTFPGSVPSTISVNGGSNANFRTPPFVNGFQKASGGWHTNSDNELLNPFGLQQPIIFDSVTIRAFGSPAEELAYEMNRRRRGMYGLMGWFGGTSIIAGGLSGAGVSAAYIFVVSLWAQDQFGDENPFPIIPVSVGGGGLITTNISVPLLPRYVGGKTAGILVTEMENIPLVSGRAGPARSMWGSRGFNAISREHVEGHAAALMHQRGISEATVYINNPRICTPCTRQLPSMLPPGSRLTVVTPRGLQLLSESHKSTLCNSGM
jgi:nucleic acid/nucleotide deaminase of polymorphic system toxin